ncbi:MAG: DUF1501 domain-containing protein [bacterium]
MKKKIQRRDLFKAAFATGGLAFAGNLGIPLGVKSVSASVPTSDYKAMVCVFLQGGNDSLNMLVPFANSHYHDARYSSRAESNLAVKDTELTIPNVPHDGTKLVNPYRIDGYVEGPIEEAYLLKGVYKPGGLTNSLSAEQEALGVNAVMPELARLIEDKKASVIQNVGTLVRPLDPGTNYKTFNDLEKLTNLPTFLFAHNQRKVLHTGVANNPKTSGWAGRIADLWDVNPTNSPLNPPFGLNISYWPGSYHLLRGDKTSPTLLSRNGPTNYEGMDYNYAKGDTKANQTNMRRRALFQALAGKKNVTMNNVTSELKDTLANNYYSTDDAWRGFYGGLLQTSEDVISDLSVKWSNVTADDFFSRKDPYGNPLFHDYLTDYETFELSEKPPQTLNKQLSAVARMIHLGKNSYQFNRQIFYVCLGGFDTHGNQNKSHPSKLRALSLSLWNFQMALEEMGLANNVTTFTMSDFGRTLTNNGDGTDHAWGASHIVMGGDGNNTSGNLVGGKLFGTFPDLAMDGGTLDYSMGKGRYVPTTSQDQVNAAICQWFGVPTNDIESKLFPNLTNFGEKYLSLFAS